MSKPIPGLAYTGVVRSWPDDGTVPEWIRFGLTDLSIGCSDDGCRALWTAYQAADDCVNRDGFTSERIEAVRSSFATFMEACDTSSTGRDGRDWLRSVCSIIKVCDLLETAIENNNTPEAARWGAGVGAFVGVVYELSFRGPVRRGVDSERKHERASSTNATKGVKRAQCIKDILTRTRRRMNDPEMSDDKAARLAASNGAFDNAEFEWQGKMVPVFTGAQDMTATKKAAAALKALRRNKS